MCLCVFFFLLSCCLCWLWLAYGENHRQCGGMKCLKHRPERDRRQREREKGYTFSTQQTRVHSGNIHTTQNKRIKCAQKAFLFTNTKIRQIAMVRCAFWRMPINCISELNNSVQQIFLFSFYSKLALDLTRKIVSLQDGWLLLLLLMLLLLFRFALIGVCLWSWLV